MHGHDPPHGGRRRGEEPPGRRLTDRATAVVDMPARPTRGASACPVHNSLSANSDDAIHVQQTWPSVVITLDGTELAFARETSRDIFVRRSSVDGEARPSRPLPLRRSGPNPTGSGKRLDKRTGAPYHSEEYKVNV